MRASVTLLNLIEKFSYGALRLRCRVDNDPNDLLVEGVEQPRYLLLVVHDMTVCQKAVVRPSLLVTGTGESTGLQLIAIIPGVAWLKQMRF